jgi:hypothetical protein
MRFSPLSYIVIDYLTVKGILGYLGKVSSQIWVVQASGSSCGSGDASSRGREATPTSGRGNCEVNTW